MKYLFLIIRHMFPRRRWKIIKTNDIIYEGVKKGVVHTLQDQFGNIRTETVRLPYPYA